jgi:hypothetical protein
MIEVTLLLANSRRTAGGQFTFLMAVKAEHVCYSLRLVA